MHGLDPIEVQRFSAATPSPPQCMELVKSSPSSSSSFYIRQPDPVSKILPDRHTKKKKKTFREVNTYAGDISHHARKEFKIDATQTR